MSLLKKLNEINPTYRSIGELTVGKTYLILKFSKKETEYGPSIEAILDDVNEGKIRTFLPKKYIYAFTEEDMFNYKGTFLHFKHIIKLYIYIFFPMLIDYFLF